MNNKSLDMLEFGRVREILASYTSFSLSRELAVNLIPVNDFDSISLLLKQSTEARDLLSVVPNFSIGGITDIRESVQLAQRGTILDPITLVEISSTLASIREMRTRLSRFQREFTLIWNIAENLIELPQIEREINNCITPNGEILDTASLQLKSIRKQVKDKHKQLLNHLGSILKSPRGTRIVQEPIITEREGRYVIPVKVESRKEIRGIVHDVSNTGATLFLEPWTTVETGNQLRELVAQEKTEVTRILRALSDKIGEYKAEIISDIELIAQLDLILAKAKYARQADAVEPILVHFGDTNQPAVLKLKNARHPLLAGKAVPLSVEIGNDYSVLVITGPNTGGKTVALKTIGLLSLMVQSGLPIPASPDSCIPVFDNIFVDIGDEQSIEQTLSTFSWHIGNIIQVIKKATNRSLVLLDELGTSTDPAEGSALARAILLYFLSANTMAIATTHFSDLKVFAHVTEGLQNASLDFDPVKLTPTYHMTIGIPGGSNALATASRLGLSREIIDQARQMLSQGDVEIETLLSDLMKEKQNVESLHIELAGEQKNLEGIKKELNDELLRLKTDERKTVQESRDKVVREAAELQRELRLATSQLRKQKSREDIERTKKLLSATRERLQAETWQIKTVTNTDNDTREVDSSITPGDTVWLRDANVQATVLSVLEDSRQVEVQAGPTRIRIGLDGIEKIVTTSKGAAPRYVPVVKPEPVKATPRELRLLGKRAEESEYELKDYLDSASLNNLFEVRIVHGSGTGRLRQVVREVLAEHPLVKSYRPGERGEGGNGVTIVRL